MNVRGAYMGLQWLAITVALVAAVLLPGCEQVQSTQVVTSEEEPERMGFYLETLHGSYSRADSVRLYIRCMRYPDGIPEVEVNGAGYEMYYVSESAWYFPSSPLDGAPMAFRITWKGDTLADTVVVPPALDTVFVNDSALRMDDMYRVTDAAADTGYHLRWNPVAGGMHYYVEMELRLGDSMGVRTERTIDTLLHAPNTYLRLPSAFDELHLDFVKVRITPRHTLPIDAEHLEPHVESERMYCYENVVGKTFEMSISGPR